MTVGVVLEPLVIVSLLAGGALVNRDQTGARGQSSSLHTSAFRRPDPWREIECGLREDGFDEERKPLSSSRRDSSASSSTRASSMTLWHDAAQDESPILSRWRERTLRFGGWECEVTVPNTEVHRDRLLSRVLQRFPFLVEVWYWALIYWVCLSSAPIPHRAAARFTDTDLAT